MEDPSYSELLVSFSLLNAVVYKSFTIAVLIGLIVITGLLFLSAMVSGSEVAFFSLNPNHLQNLRINKSRRNQLILRLLEKPKRLLATILIANNFINVAIVIIAAYVSAELFDFSKFIVLGFIIEVIVVTSIILLAGEIMPKMYASQHADKFAGFMSKPMTLLIRLFYPLSSILVKSTNMIDRRLSKKGHNISMSELSDAIELTVDDSTREEEKKILKGIVKFGDIDVKEIMKSRVDVVALDINTPFRELLNIILESGYSRLPVYEDSFDKIAGILYIKDLLPHLSKSNDFSWQPLLRPAFFVPENKGINDLLKEFQEKKIHLAIVVDEYGGTSGIITLEDIIEEIVGEINDEFDNQTDEIVYSKLDDNNYIFEGKTSLNDFCKILELDDRIFEDVKGDSDTLAGLILEMEGKIPERNEEIKYRNFLFNIESVDKRRIKRIKVSIKSLD